MGLLSSVAKAGARATGRALAAHVLPDSLVPSWKTQKKLSSGYSLLKKAAKKTKPAKTNKTGSTKRPGAVAPKKKFDKNGWANGRTLPSGAGFVERPPSPQKSSFLSSASKQVSRLKRQSIDLARNPRLGVQMGLDLLKEDYKTKRASFLSEANYLKSLVPKRNKSK